MATTLAVKWAAVNQWHVKPEIQSEFDKYWCVVWDGTTVMDLNLNGEIKNTDDVYYKINWIDTPVECYRANKCSLSFRRIRGCEEGYVLIRRFSPEKAKA